MENVKLDSPVDTIYKRINPIDLSMWVHTYGDGNMKVGDSHQIATLTDLAIAFNDLFFREGFGSFIKSTQPISYETPCPAGSILHIDFKAWNAIGNVNATIISRDENGFMVKVDADCDWSYTAKIINL